MTTLNSGGISESVPHETWWSRIRVSDVILIVLSVLVFFRVGEFVGQLTAGDSHVTWVCGQSPANTMTVHPGTQVGFACGP